jgi:purine catabolism regulator
LLRLAEGPSLAQFVESELGPLMDRDLTTAVPLLPTLTSYLDNSGNKVVTARALNIGRRSLYYRLDRIGLLLGRDLDDTDVRLRLSLALRGLTLLRARR